MENPSAFTETVVEVTQQAFNHLFELQAQYMARREQTDPEMPFEVSGLIGFTGPGNGSLVVNLTLGLAEQLANHMFCEGPEDPVEKVDMADCASEIANILAGNLLPHLGPVGNTTANLSLPHGVVGRHQITGVSQDTPYTHFFFDSPKGSFVLGIRHVPASPRDKSSAV